MDNIRHNVFKYNSSISNIKMSSCFFIKVVCYIVMIVRVWKVILCQDKSSNWPDTIKFLTGEAISVHFIIGYGRWNDRSDMNASYESFNKLTYYIIFTVWCHWLCCFGLSYGSCRILSVLLYYIAIDDF